MKQTYYTKISCAVLVGLAIMLMPLRAEAQSKKGPPFGGGNGGNQSCPTGTSLLAKFENNDAGQLIFEKPGGNEDEVVIDSVDLDDEGEIAGGSWTSATTAVSILIVKGGPSSELVTLTTPTTSGMFSNDVLGGFEVSNLKFCASEPGNCVDNLPRLQNAYDSIDEDDRTISNTVLDGDGLTEIEFTLLDNVADVQITSPGGLTWSTTDGGTTWVPPTGTVPTEATYVLQAEAGTESGSYFLVATSTCGEVTNFDPPFTIENGFTSRFEIDGSYPNPFHTQTTVQFELGAPAHARLTVYDVMGRKVATLVDASMTTGSHEVVWNGRAGDGSTVASGIYFVRLEAGDRVQTQRVTLIK